MPELVSKDESLEGSMPVIGARILTELAKSTSGSVSIFDLVSSERRRRSVDTRSMYFAMLFLYSVGLVEFDPPYLALVQK